MLIKQSLEDWLSQVDYKGLETDYVPTHFSLMFLNFIKLVNGEQGEDNKTPILHLKMLDKLTSNSAYIANLLFRGAAKTTVFMEYLSLYIAVFGELPGFGSVTGIIYVSDSMDNGVKNARKNIEYRYENSEFLKEWIPKAVFTDKYLEFTNKQGGRLGIKMFGAKTGIRGTKIFGKRPVLAILDDLVSDEDANSKASMITIKDTVYKGVNHALDPTRRKIIFNGTPFNKEDVLVEAVESGAWDVNVWPVCETFPCTREQFSGAWPDRFSFDFIQSQYNLAVETGKLSSFYQELMIQITSEDERLVQDDEIRWYSRQQLLSNKQNFNFYITSDFATSDKSKADFNVISVWAYNSNGDWFWVDGICARQTMNHTVDDLFRLVQEYVPLSVGIEVTGQQGGFVSWLQEEMMNRNIWFNFASNGKGGEAGIRPPVDKLSRFQLVVPWFKAGKFYFPEELRASVIIGVFLQQIRMATKNGIKGKDDAIDTISMLAYMKAWKPSSTGVATPNDVRMWDMHETVETSPLSNYIV